MTVLRELWYCHVAVLSFHASSSSNPPRFPCAYPFLSDFRGQFWRSSGTQNGSCGISSESSRRPLSNDIKFARIGVRTRELWLPEGSRGVGAVFVHSSDADSGQTGNAIGEPRVPRRSRSHYLSNAPGLADQLVASRKDSAREGGSCAAYFCKVPDLRKSELGLVRYGPANRGHRGVFGPFEGSFPIGIPAGPDKILRDPRFHVESDSVFKKPVGKSLILSPVFTRVASDSFRDVVPTILACVPMIFRFVRKLAWPCIRLCLGGVFWVRSHMNLLTEIPELPSESRFNACASEAEVIALRVRKSLMPSCTTSRGSLGTSQNLKGLARTKLFSAGRFAQRRVFSQSVGPLRPSECSSCQGVLVWSMVRSNLGQTWSTLVKLGQTWSKLSKLLEMYPGLHFKGFRARWVLVGLETARSNLGQTLVNSSQTWSTLVKLGQTLGNVSRTFFLGVFDGDEPSSEQADLVRAVLVLRADTRENPGAANRVVSTVWNLSPNKLRSDLTWGLPKLQIGCKSGGSTVWNLSPNRLRSDLTWGLPKLQIGWFNGLESQSKQVEEMSDRGSGSGGHRRSDRLAKGKAVAYAPESSPDTDDEYDAMEDVRTRLDASLARNLQAELDAEAAGLAPSAARPPPRPGVVIGRSARPSETTRPSPQPGVTTGPSDAPSAAPRRPHTRSTDILPMGGIRPRYPVAVEISDTPLLTNLLAHPSSLVRRCQEPPDSAGRGGWSDFCRLLEASRPEYREFLIELGFGPFLSIPYVSVYHPAVWCFIERFFHHTGTFHLSTCEMAVLPVDWSAILGIRFGGRAPPSEPIDGFEAREILGLADRDAIEGSRRPSVRIRHLADVLRRDREEPPTELRYRQWAAYFIFSCFLGNDRSIVPTPIVGMFRDIDTLREYDWGALTYGFYIRGLRRYSRRESISFLGFWQFTVFWAFEHFPTFAPSRLPLASDPDFPLARRMLISSSSPYSAALSQRPEVFRAVALSRLRLWIRTPRSWELLLGERTVRQLGDEAVVPVDPSPLMTIEDYIPRAPSDPYIAGVSAYPSLVREDVPYQEWFERVSLGSLMSLHEVEGGRVMGGVAMDSHLIRSSGQIERLESEVLRLQLELSVSVDRHTADMDRVQGEMASMQTEATQREGEMVRMRRDLASRDAEVARLAAAVRRLEEQLQGMGITPVTGADLSGLGQPSSSPPRDPVSRDWFFDDPPSS
uniref:Aminotransferase-like plant mobile domain-containing protein n=1 Tax=Fagus sylvatica TaxID=28930 RepID=A0A2N9GK73_FAGSY